MYNLIMKNCKTRVRLPYAPLLTKNNKTMKKDLTFLGTTGITSTSANHVANIAKEYILQLEEFIDGISFLNVEIELLSEPGSMRPYMQGSLSEDLAKVEGVIMTIGATKSLIAWLREAIKAKEALLVENNSLSVTEWCEQNGKKWPEIPSITPYHIEDAIAELSVEQRHNYIRLQTLASTFGKIIHPAGHISAERKALYETLKKPVELKGEGNNTVIYTSNASILPQDVDREFFELQRKQRSYQAEFNSIQHDLENKVILEQQKRRMEYMNLHEKCKLERESLTCVFNQYQESEAKRISELKIVIPQSLKSIYDAINSLGKQGK